MYVCMYVYECRDDLALNGRGDNGYVGVGEGGDDDGLDGLDDSLLHKIAAGRGR